MKILRLKEHSDNIQLTPEEAFEMIKEDFKKDDSLLLIHLPKNGPWKYTQSGSITEGETVWTLGKMILQLLQEDEC